MDFTEKINNWMKENNVRQIDLANMCNMDKGYISNIVKGKKNPSKKFLLALEKASGKDTNWWMFGKDSYDNLDSLNMLINTFIESGEIKTDGTYDKEIEIILKTMLDKEIRVKLQNKNTSDEITATKDNVVELNTRNDESMPIAAHANEGANKEDIKHDLDIMNDDSQW
ncbi:helix-turn-helix domain-containing protein [Clostridium butyricum]|uniref:helix-turn-helix domain-containing protein n=2 Tax=Clostridium butyricum TaxID=1492 RepID=UPI00189EF4F9|nr:helix-turn-helix transcriptional regulator [Clostridium butyricum]MDB2150569.1 helix-turn-helix transcriptional regulator [Clostridium butyricum]